MKSLTDVAERAARAGGDYLAGEFRQGPVAGDYGTDDVKATVDRAAERRVRRVVGEAFPDHAVRGEELDRDGPRDAPYEWVVDPLDGTNNFASGIPSFATAVAALRGGEPVVSAIYEPLPGSLYLARRGAGATVNGAPLEADSDLPLDCGTVSFVVGLPAIRDDGRRAVADCIEAAVGSRCKRVLSSWSPCVDWGLLARGAIEGVVCFHPNAYEQHAGALLAEESGVRAVDDGATYVAAADATTLGTLRDAVAEARGSARS